MKLYGVSYSAVFYFLSPYKKSKSQGVKTMNYANMKIYFDGGHYVGIPQGAFPSGKGCKRLAVKSMKQQSTADVTPLETQKKRFETAYKESQSLPKRERKAHIKAAMKDDFKDKAELNAFVEKHTERMNTNAIKRKVRLMRKLRLQEWNFFVTFTYSNEFHTEETFRKKLSNTLKHLVARNGWKYVGVWERGEDTNRLHFHGIFYIPDGKMIGKLEEVKDYDTRNHRMQTTYQNTHFLKQFGRNDFKDIATQDDISEAAKYITKYMEKSGERLVYGGKLPTYFRSDVLDEDVICAFGIDDRKVLLFDNFTCINEGEILGKVSKEIISQLPHCN